MSNTPPFFPLAITDGIVRSVPVLLMIAILVMSLVCRAAGAWQPPKKSQRLTGMMESSSRLCTSKRSQQHIEKEDNDHHVYNDGRRNFLKQSTAFGGAVGAAATNSLFATGLFPIPATSAEPSSSTITSRSDDGGAKKEDLRDVKVALWGFGNQNKLMARYLLDRNVPIVAVISHHDVGKDFAAVLNSEEGPSVSKRGNNKKFGHGVKIVAESDARETLLATQPDVCLLCTRSSLQDIQPSVTVCAESKVNVVTIAEELINSRASSPALTRDMDALFRENGVTLTGSGMEDIAYGEMIMTCSALMHRIDGIEASEQYNLNDYGLVLAQDHGAGLTPSQFRKQYANDANDQEPSWFCNFNMWFVAAFGLDAKESTVRREPTFASTPVWSTPLQREIPVGDCTGMKFIATTTTRQGITISSEFVGKTYGPDDVDYYNYGFQGEPSGVKFSMTNVPAPALTNTAAMSRILQVVNAPSGYVTSDTFRGAARYQYWT